MGHSDWAINLCRWIRVLLPWNNQERWSQRAADGKWAFLFKDSDENQDFPCSTCNLTLISISAPLIMPPTSTIHTHWKKFSLSATYFQSIWKDFYKRMNVNSSLASGWQSIMESSRNIYIIIMIFFLLRRWDVCTSGHQFNLFLHLLCVRKLPRCENNSKCILISVHQKEKTIIFTLHCLLVAVMTIYKWISHCSF